MIKFPFFSTMSCRRVNVLSIILNILPLCFKKTNIKPIAARRLEKGRVNEEVPPQV